MDLDDDELRETRKIEVPITLSEEELFQIQDRFQELQEMAIKTLSKDKDILIFQNIIKIQKMQIDVKDKEIEYMLRHIAQKENREIEEIKKWFYEMADHYYLSNSLEYAEMRWRELENERRRKENNRKN